MQLRDGLDKVKAFLNERRLHFEQDGETIVVPYEIDGMHFLPRIDARGKWITVSCRIVHGKDLPSSDPAYLAILFKKLLRAIHDLPEINYDVDDENSIYASVDMRMDITDYDNFTSEFFAVPYGIKYFIESIAPVMDPPVVVRGKQANTKKGGA